MLAVPGLSWNKGGGNGVIGLTISTSKRGPLWRAEYWKTLIDSLCRGGAKHDPRLRYPAMATCLGPLVREDAGRFLPTSASTLAEHDDTAITSLRIVRVKDGEDAVRLHEPVLANVDGWPLLEVDFFGTIGSRKQEDETRKNLARLETRAEEIVREPSATSLWLHFQLSAERRDRDLDNLGDGLMSLFNRWFPGLDEVQLSKGPARAGWSECMWIGAHRVRFGVLEGRLTVPDDFDAALPDDLISGFEGEPQGGRDSKP